MSKKKPKKIKNKSNPILWFLLAIVVPLIVAITIIIIIFAVAGFNVIDWAKYTGNNIPVISSVVKTDKEIAQQGTEDAYKHTITKKDKKIDKLKTNVTDLEATVDKLQQDMVKLENVEKSKKESDKEPNPAKEDKNKQLTAMTSSFEEIDPKQTALILQDLDEEMVIAILKGLSKETRAGIFEEMDPESAAQYTKAYLNSGE